MNEKDRNDPETKIGAYLTVMVKNGGADLFLHTGAKPTIKGNSGFKSLDTILDYGETERILHAMLTDAKMRGVRGKWRSGLFIQHFRCGSIPW